MANRRAGAKTEVESKRKKSNLSLPPKTAKPVRTPPKTETPVKPVMPVMPPDVSPVAPPAVSSQTPPAVSPVKPVRPERPATPVDASRIKAAMRDNPLPKIGNDLVKMNKGGKIRGYGMARGGKVCKMR